MYFASNRGGDFDIFKRRADLSGEPEPVFEADGVQLPSSISADGTVLLFDDSGTGRGNNIGMISLDGDPEPRMLVEIDANTRRASISPDGRFFAFQSNETGSDQIHVQEIEARGRQPISTGGGTDPVWSHDGSEIFYRPAPEQRSVVEVVFEPRLAFSAPRLLFDTSRTVGTDRPFDVTADGQEFLMVLQTSSLEIEAEPVTPHIIVVLNWFEELKRLVPTGGSQ